MRKSPPPATQDSPQIGIGGEELMKIHELLNGILADQHVLYLKTRNFHWNLVGDRFRTLHEFYEEQYDDLATAIDETAERIRMLGGVARGSMREFLDGATLEETPGALVHGVDSITALVSDHEACIRSLREAVSLCDEEYDDAGTADFLTALLQKHEQAAWMLRSFLG